MIKVRLQCTPRGTYAGPWDCLKRTVQSEGPRALYKGSSALQNREWERRPPNEVRKIRERELIPFCAVTGATPPAFGWTLSDSLLMVRFPSFLSMEAARGSSVVGHSPSLLLFPFLTGLITPSLSFPSPLSHNILH